MICMFFFRFIWFYLNSKVFDLLWKLLTKIHKPRKNLSSHIQINLKSLEIIQILFFVLNSVKKRKKYRYLQLTFNVTVVSRRWPSDMARFQTTHRYFAPSSSFCGVIDNVLVVWRSFDPPRLIGACNGIVLPSRYQLKNNFSNKTKKFSIMTNIILLTVESKSIQ